MHSEPQPDGFLTILPENGKFDKLPPGEDGMLRSQVFPGLWLDPQAVFNDDGKRWMEVLQQGPAAAEHAACMARLARVSRGGTRRP